MHRVMQGLLRITAALTALLAACNEPTVLSKVDGPRAAVADINARDVANTKRPGTTVIPSLGRGELLRERINSVAIAHGLLNLIDAFPFQHPEAPALSVSVPMTERLFGQGVRATFANVVVTIEDKGGSR